MNLRALLLTLPTAAVALAAPQDDVIPAPEPRWYADYDEAAAAAKAEGKDLLVDFTGSDWCGWCIKLDKEVFEHAEFFEPVTEKFVLVKLDFPRGKEAKAKVPNPERNAELQQEHGVRGFPTILLMTNEGEVLAQTGYQPGGPAPYTEYVLKAQRAGRAMLKAAVELPARYEAAEGAEAQTAVVKDAIALVAGAVEGVAGVDALAPIVRAAYELDPENATGLKKDAVAAIMKGGVAEEGDLEVASALDPKNEHGLLEQVVMARMYTVRDDDTANAFIDSVLAFAELGKVHDKDSLKETVMRATMWAHQPLGRTEDAQKLLAFAETLGDVPQELKDALKQ